MAASARTPRRRSLLRTRGAVVAALLAGLAGGGASAGLLALNGDGAEPGSEGPMSMFLPQVDPKTLSGEGYAKAEPGSCLTWQLDGRGAVTSFGAVDCGRPHRFEVASRVDLGTDPRFGRDAAFPDASTRAGFGTQRCLPDVQAYTAGRPIDPQGRFTVTVVPPSEEGWRKGDHSVLCGVTTTELGGASTLTTGRFADADQHRSWQPGTCLGLTADGRPGAPVDCSADHSVEIVAHLPVADLYSGKGEPPDARGQSEATAEACHQAGADYVGGAEPLRESTLISTLVDPISTVSWQTGSRTVDCGLMKARAPGQFAVLRGSARQGVQIDGAAPTAPTTTTIPVPSGSGQAPTPPEAGGTSVPTSAAASSESSSGGGASDSGTSGN